MKEQEAKKVINILLTADRFCSFCSKDLIRRFAIKFPEFKELANNSYKTKYEK